MMELHCFKSFWLLWILIKMSHGVEGPLLTHVFHKYRGIVYKNHPFQLLCSASLQANEHLHLWINAQGSGGNRFDVGEYKFGDKTEILKRMPNLVFKLLPDRLGQYPGEIKRMVVLKICAMSNIHMGRIFCNAVSNNTTSMRSDEFGFIHVRNYAPRPPKFKVHYHLTPNIAISNMLMRIDCSAIVDENGTMVFKFSRHGKNVAWRISIRGGPVSFPPDRDPYASFHYYKEMTKDGMRLDVAMDTRLKPEHNGGIFRCYTVDRGHIVLKFSQKTIEETKSDIIEVKDYPYKPYIVVLKSSINKTFFEFLNPRLWDIEGYCGSRLPLGAPLSVLIKNGLTTETYILMRNHTSKAKLFKDPVFDEKKDTLWYSSIWKAGWSPVNHIANFRMLMDIRSESAEVRCQSRGIQRCRTIKNPFRGIKTGETMTANVGKAFTYVPLVVLVLLLSLLVIALAKLTLKVKEKPLLAKDM